MNFTLEWLQSKTEEIAYKYNYPVPIVKLNPKLSICLGRCIPEESVIEYNTRFISRNREEVIIALIKHEVCHLRNHGHGEKFQRAAKDMGIKAHVWMQFSDIVEVGDFYYKCPVCDAIHTSGKKQDYCCGVCTNMRYDIKTKLEFLGTDKELYGNNT